MTLNLQAAAVALIMAAAPPAWPQALCDHAIEPLERIQAANWDRIEHGSGRLDAEVYGRALLQHRSEIFETTAGEASCRADQMARDSEHPARRSRNLR